MTRSPEEPQNEGMQQTKPAFSSVCAGFAADPRCSTHSSDAGTPALRVLATALVLICFLIGVPAEASKRPLLPTHDDLQRTWLGFDGSGAPTCRLELHADGTGLFTVLGIVAEGATRYRVTHYRLAGYRITFALEPVDASPEGIYLGGDAVRGHLKLVIGARDANWQVTMSLLPLETVLDRIDLLADGNDSLVERGQE